MDVGRAGFSTGEPELYGLDDIAGGGRGCQQHRIAQLAHVARPVMRRELPDRRYRQQERRPPDPPATLVEERPRQQLDLAWPLAQRRGLDPGLTPTLHHGA